MATEVAPEIKKWNPSDKELKALRQEYASNATDAQFELWIEMCKRRNLIPVEDVVLQIRTVREWDEEEHAKVAKRKAIFITTIRALLKIAERTLRYKGFTPVEWIYLDDKGFPLINSLVPLSDPKAADQPRTPWACRVGIRRQGFEEAQFMVGRFGAYAQTYTSGDKKYLNATWSTRGPEQLAKCTKAAAIREAFPEDAGDLYLAEEFNDDDTPGPKTETTTTTAAATLVPPPVPATTAPAVNHTPAEGKAEPRPGGEKPVEPTPEPAKTEVAPEKKTKTLEEATTEALEAGQAKSVQEKGAKKSKGKKAATPETPPEAPKTETATPAPPSADPTSNDSRVPTKDELSQKIMPKITGFRDRLGGPGSDGSSKLRAFILKNSGQLDTKTITLQQWGTIIKTLDEAFDDNDLRFLVGSKD